MVLLIIGMEDREHTMLKSNTMENVPTSLKDIQHARLIFQIFTTLQHMILRYLNPAVSIHVCQRVMYGIENCRLSRIAMFSFVFHSIHLLTSGYSQE